MVFLYGDFEFLVSTIIVEYIKNLFGNLAELLNIEGYLGDVGLIPIISITLLIFLFCLELFFYLLKRPKGLSNLILIVGVLGTLASLYVVLVDYQQTFNVPKKVISAQLLSCALVGLVGGFFALCLFILESLCYSNIDASRSVDYAVKDLVRLLKGNIAEAQKNNGASPDANFKLELQHISQQIYDLTHHLKQELSETRNSADKNANELMSNLPKLLKETETGRQSSAVLGPKIVAKTSANSQLPTNDSTVKSSK